MKNLLLPVSLLLVLSATSFGQQKAQVTFQAQTQEPDLLSVIRFLNIDINKVKVQGEGLKGRHYKIRVKRFDQGKLTLNSVAFDSTELGDFGKLAKDELNFRVMSKASEGSAKIEFQFDRFSNGKVYTCKKASHEYVMKTFLGVNSVQEIVPSQETAILAFLLPTEHSDGSASYCEVAQSGVNPDNLGKIFQIPTYFLITIQFV